MNLSDPIKVMLAAAQKLESLGIYYYVGGSLASSAYGIPRSTQDVDIIADIQEHHIDRLVEAFSDEFYIDREMIRESLKYKSSFNVIHLETMIKVDIYIFDDTPFAHSKMSRRKKESIEGAPEASAYLSSAEDVILQKLRWYVIGGKVSDQQWKDILGVLKVQSKEIDFKYLKSWATKLDLLKLLNQALKEAESYLK
ncbi:MAG: hypothetical protein MUC94_05470 [bacterium]|jgi:hypothetical protein|nr:hypothetical protein [bacterium]